MGQPKLRDDAGDLAKVLGGILTFFGGQPVKIDMVTVTTCENPNEYTVGMRSTRPGQAYMGTDRTPVAMVSNIPPTQLETKGRGSIEADITIAITNELVQKFFGVLGNIITGQPVPVYVETSMEMDIDVNLLLGDFSVQKPFDKKCGFNLGVNLGQPSLGPMVCGDSWEALGELPPISGSEPAGTVKLSALRLAENEVEEGNRLKNLALGLTMGLGYGLGILLILTGAAGFAVLLCPRFQGKDVADDASNNSGEMRAVKIGAPGHAMEEA